jgi:hypothetical protein
MQIWIEKLGATVTTKYVMGRPKLNLLIGLQGDYCNFFSHILKIRLKEAIPLNFSYEKTTCEWQSNKSTKFINTTRNFSCSNRKVLHPTPKQEVGRTT